MSKSGTSTSTACCLCVSEPTERLPFADVSFDLVSANMVLEHLRDPARVFKEVARALAPGGAFVFVTPNRVASGGCRGVTRAGAAMAPAFWRTGSRGALDHIFVTYYRANSPAAVLRHAGSAGLLPERLDTFSSYPMCLSPKPLVFLECLAIPLCVGARLADSGPIWWEY